MFKIYDDCNKYLYAQGTTVEELIKDWNKKAEDNFSWILENENNQDFYNLVTEKCYRIENILQICNIVNNVEVNQLELYKNNEVLNEI